MKRKLLIVLSVIMILGLSLSLFACSEPTTALWQGQGDDTRDREADVTQVNGSEKYIVFAALDSSGNFIPTESSATVAAYAVVGYTGTVAELTIPSTYLDTTLYASPRNVTKVAVCESNGTGYAAYKLSRNGATYTGDYAPLANNPVVTSMVLGTNVSSVGALVCVGMTNLTTITFENTSGVTVGANAFLACTSLSRVSFACASGAVTLNGNFSGLTITYAS